jgi:hypothetical protein
VHKYKKNHVRMILENMNTRGGEERYIQGFSGET